ncbi:MAG: dTMP kinase [Candidatus Gastranaerophilales bacterium]|nr:dTMP kinase [Candidatus Gastranaerophilales bacterium]
MTKGLFITLEGADGSGKTTQMERIIEYFQKNNLPYLVTKEPGGVGVGEKIREILLNHKGPVSSRCEMFLYLADRAQNIDVIVQPAIAEGKMVLCDRHADSTVAYQGYARGLDVEQINMLNNIATAGRKPDLTLLFDVETSVAMQRVGNRAEKDRLESEGAVFHAKVRQGYLAIAQKEPERIKIVDANLSVEEVWTQVKRILDSEINPL